MYKKITEGKKVILTNVLKDPSFHLFSEYVNIKIKIFSSVIYKILFELCCSVFMHVLHVTVSSR